MTGPAGPAGALGPAGPQGPAGAVGPAGGFGAFGAFYDTADHQLAQNVPTPIPLSVTQSASNVSIVDGHKVTIDAAGTFNIAFSSQLWNQQNQRHNVTIWLSRNGTAVSNWLPETATDLFLGTSADAERDVAAWNFFVDAQPGDFFVLMIIADGTNTWLWGGDSDSPNPDIPQIPSTMLTVHQVG